MTVVYDKGESDFSNALSVNSTSAITETTASEGKVYVAGRTIVLSGIGSLTAGVWTVDGKCVWRRRSNRMLHREGGRSHGEGSREVTFTPTIIRFKKGCTRRSVQPFCVYT